jgi:hypothetical protein
MGESNEYLTVEPPVAHLVYYLNKNVRQGVCFVLVKLQFRGFVSRRHHYGYMRCHTAPTDN